MACIRFCMYFPVRTIMFLKLTTINQVVILYWLAVLHLNLTKPQAYFTSLYECLEKHHVNCSVQGSWGVGKDCVLSLIPAYLTLTKSLSYFLIHVTWITSIALTVWPWLFQHSGCFTIIISPFWLANLCISSWIWSSTTLIEGLFEQQFKKLEVVTGEKWHLEGHEHRCYSKAKGKKRLAKSLTARPAR